MDWKSVYVMKESNGLIKIGVSKNVEQRKKTIESTFGISVHNLFSTNPCSNPFEIEAFMHRLFSNERVYGEWFWCDYGHAVSELKKAFDNMAKFDENKGGEKVMKAFMESVNSSIEARNLYVKELEKYVDISNEIIGKQNEQIKKLIGMVEHLQKCIYTDYLKPDDEEKFIPVAIEKNKLEDALSEKEVGEIFAHISRKAVSILGGKGSEANKNIDIYKNVFSDIGTQIKREYGLGSSYKSIKRKYLADVHDFIDCYELPRYLEEQINECNAQMRMGGM